MSKRLVCCLVLLSASLFLGACDQIDTLTNDASISQITNAPFYAAVQATIARIQIPVLVVGVIMLCAGWKLGRFGLAINGLIIGGVIIYTALTQSEFIPDENFRIGISVGGGILIGLLTYFLYSFMALIIGGATGMTLMNGTWLQFAENVPPAILVFIITFVSALVMFVVFRVFLVAFSAVIGAVILMLAVPFDTPWVIPVAAVGIAIQTGVAWWIKDDIFKNIRGDLGAALGEAFGEVLGPFAVLRERQRGDREKEQPERQKSSRAAPEPRPAAPPPYQPPQQPVQPQRPVQPQQDYRPVQPPQPQQPAQYQGPVQPQQPVQPQRPAPQQDYRPVQPPQPQQPPQFQRPAPQPPQPGYQPPTNVPPHYQPMPQPSMDTQPTPHVPMLFRPEDYQLTLPNGQSFPLTGLQMTVGRNADCNIVIIDPQISGVHLICSIQPEGIVVWDNNSTNGTYLNGVLLTGSYRLTPSDVLQVGSVTLRLTRRSTAQ